MVEKIITNFSNKKDVVYDPFLGTGTTAFVAKKLGRNYLGSELLESYFNFAQERLDTDISEQLDLLEK